MKIKIISHSDEKQTVFVDNYKLEGGFLVLSNPRQEENSPECDGMYIGCSHIKIFTVIK